MKLKNLKMPVTTITQTLVKGDEPPKVNVDRLMKSRSRTVDAFRNQPVSGEFIYGLAKYSEANRTLLDGTLETITLKTEYKTLEELTNKEPTK